MILRTLAGAVAVLAMAEVAAAEPWKFVVFGDTRSGSSSDNSGVYVSVLSELAAQTVAEGAKFMLVPGDLAYAGSTTGAFTVWKDTMASVYGANIGVYPIMGNHDVSGMTAWNTAFGADLPDNGSAGEINRTYSFSYNNAFVVGLDNYVTDGRVNQGWLDGQFAANDKPHVFVFGHEPAFKANHVDCLDDYPAERNAFWQSITSATGRTYFCGHDHLYAHARIDDGDGNPDDDLHQFIVGPNVAPGSYHTSYSYNGVNGPYTPVAVADQFSTPGYLLVTIDGDQVTMDWKSRTLGGSYATVDSFAYSVPEPGSIGVLLLGVWGLVRGRRR
jgi:hypothetical protein